MLPNGLTVLYQKRSGKACAVQVMVKVGSNDESSGRRGIAHFVEHLVFEGTPKRDNSQVIANEIESLGGEFNAYTTNWRTCYYVKMLNKHAGKALGVLGDILQNAIFREKDFVRERSVILKEIDMLYDDPKSFQWLQLEKRLFKLNKCRFPSSGDRKDILALGRDEVYAFYKERYVPSNMVISICGDVPNFKKLVSKCFGSFASSGKGFKRPKVYEKELLRNGSFKVKRKYSSSYLMMGARTPARRFNDSYVLDVIMAILGRGQSGVLFHEIRGKLGLAYDVGVEHCSDVDFGYFVIYASASLKNIAKVKSVIRRELDKLEDISDKALLEAKRYIEGDHLMGIDDSLKVADTMLYWEDVGGKSGMDDYVAKVKAVSKADIKRVVRKYLKNFYSMVLEGR